MLSPRALVWGIPARAKFAAENSKANLSYAAESMPGSHFEINFAENQ